MTVSTWKTKFFLTWFLGSPLVASNTQNFLLGYPPKKTLQNTITFYVFCTLFLCFTFLYYTQRESHVILGMFFSFNYPSYFVLNGILGIVGIYRWITSVCWYPPRKKTIIALMRVTNLTWILLRLKIIKNYRFYIQL